MSLKPGWAERITASPAASPGEQPAPVRKSFRRSRVDDKRAQLRGAHAASKSKNLDKVLGPVEDDE